MIAFIKKYRAFIYGLIIFRLLVFVLSFYDVILIDNAEVLTNTLGFLFGWLFISLPIYYFPLLRQYKNTSFKLVGLIILFFIIIINDLNAKITNNPITFIGLVAIGLSIFTMIAPAFFKKYILVIVVYYVLALGYFLYVRVYINNLNFYLQQEKEIKIILITPFFIMFLTWFYQQWKWLKTVESKKTKAELALLKSQINPHFFFNTLNNLYGLTAKKSDDAPSVVLKLSEMMRYTIYMGKEDYIPLKKEVEYLNNYIELHKIRYKKDIEISFNYPENTDIQVAPLLLIIPLENAFKHGVERLTEGAYIHINMHIDSNTLLFEIENNFEELDGNEQKGIGLENLRHRLQLLYPNKHKIAIEVKERSYKFSLKIETT